MDKSFHLQKLGKTFKSMRINRGLTQVEVAKFAGINRLRVIDIESGRDSVSIGSYEKLAAALGGELTIIPKTRPTLEELKDFK